MNNNIGDQIYNLIAQLYPICRSITGNGTRETLKIIQNLIPIEIHEIPTGTKVFDWVIPKEWNIKDGYIKNANGLRVIDFKDSNLHVPSYSIPIRQKITLNELKNNLFTLPEHPNWIPYLTTYYHQKWGFALTHNQLRKLEDGEYEINIDSILEDGSLTYGELYINGESEDEILFSTYICHPSLCNDNLSGISLLTFLIKNLFLKRNKLKYSYRFLFVPETIGAITWLSINEDKISKIKHGFVITCVGDSGEVSFKGTKNGDGLIDRIVVKALQDSEISFKIIPFCPESDERQYSSPAFNIPTVTLMRSGPGRYPQYHTSADNLNFISPLALEDSYRRYEDVIHILENNETYNSLNPKGEPQLSNRIDYRIMGEKSSLKKIESAMLLILLYSDGKTSLLDIASKSQINFKIIKKAADILLDIKLLEKNTTNETW